MLGPARRKIRDQDSYRARHRLLSVDDWYAWLPGRQRPVLATFGYTPRHYAPEES